MVGDHIGIPGVVSFVFFSFAGQMSWQVDPIFRIVGCIGVWKWLIWAVNINSARPLLVIIAGGSVCPVVKTAVTESTHGVHKTVLSFAWLFSQAGEALYSV
jgi:hypothetical protein